MGAGSSLVEKDFSLIFDIFISFSISLFFPVGVYLTQKWGLRVRSLRFVQSGYIRQLFNSSTYLCFF